MEARSEAAVPIRISIGALTLSGDLSLPPGAACVIMFAHGSGSGRRSPRNRHVARALQGAGLGTLLLDLLTEDEERVDLRTAHLRFDIDLLARRLIGARRWLAAQPRTGGLPVGYFGASTGAGAALVAAAVDPAGIFAIVSRGGRPDLAGPALSEVCAPTLLIVGGRDTEVIALNRRALAQLRAERRLVIVPGAAHLFEEPGALEEVARLARDWFASHLRGQAAAGQALP